MLIRRANPEDGEAIQAVQLQSTQVLTASHYAREQVEASMKLVASQHYTRIDEEQPVFVAEDPPGSIVGFSHLSVPDARVEAVFVHPEHVRHGIGTQLLQALEETAREAGLTELELDSNLNAVVFYEHAGYKVEEQIVPKLHGVDYPVMVMRKTLAAKLETETS